MIRVTLVAIFVGIFLIVSLPIQFVEFLIGKFNPGVKDRSSLAIVNWAFRVVLFLSGVSVTVLGEENVPKDEAVLYIGNHRSYFDIIMTYVRVPRPTGYMAKVGMLHVPSLSTWMKYLHCIFLDRSDIKSGLQSILDAVEQVRSGVSICIFPEGTRNRTSEPLLDFHDGCFKIAEKTGCPIVPMSINNAAEIWENHLPKIKKTHVVIEYAKPIYVKNMDKEQRRSLNSMVKGIIETNYLKNQELV